MFITYVHTIVDLSITSLHIIIQDTVFVLYGGYRSNQSNLFHINFVDHNTILITDYAFYKCAIISTD